MWGVSFYSAHEKYSPRSAFVNNKFYNVKVKTDCFKVMSAMKTKHEKELGEKSGDGYKNISTLLKISWISVEYIIKKFKTYTHIQL